MQTVRFEKGMIKIISILLLLFLSSCASQEGNFNGNHSSAGPKRTIPQNYPIDDIEIEEQIRRIVTEKYGTRIRVNAVSLYGRVLLTGEIPQIFNILDFEKKVLEIKGVTALENDIAISQPRNIDDEKEDLSITSKAFAALKDAKGISSDWFIVHTDKKVVYLIGTVTQAEGQTAAEIVREKVPFVKKIVKFFIYVPENFGPNKKNISNRRKAIELAQSETYLKRKNEGINNNKIDRDRRMPQDNLAQAEGKNNYLQRKNLDFSLQVSHTKPAADGSVIINVKTSADTASLEVNGEEQGGNSAGDYVIKKIARAGQDTKFTITATDINGNKDTKVITVTREVLDSPFKYAQLNPTLIRPQPTREAVAIIIGITNYRSLPKAEFANDDARVFYDYAIRALGVKPENIKLLVDADAEEVEIIKAFKTWLPSRVKSTTDVYVFYSGHGLPTQDGQGLYLLPPRADRDFISRTSIQFQEISADIQASKPKSVTIFMDACYSGQARSGETLVANARPVTLRAEKKLFPDNFTVITASQADQISSSSPDLKHGIFSYYLMKGMEGDADANKDGKITLGEMQSYLTENVGRHAGMMSRKQEPQMIGDVGRVLVGGLSKQ
jgi:osmotically-inducible protein OsmY